MEPQAFKYIWTENKISADSNHLSVVYSTENHNQDVTAYVLDPVHQTALIWIPNTLKNTYIQNDIPFQYISADPVNNLKYHHAVESTLSGWFVCGLNSIKPA